MVQKLIIVQARMGSQRLPGKSLARIGNRPLLGHTLDAILSRFDRDQVVVATSKSSESDAIVDFCKASQVEVYRGDEENVASRFQEIIQNRHPELVCRISGDSPFIDVSTIEKAFADAEKKGADLVSTTGGKFPSGMNVEVFKAKTFLTECPRFSKPEHLEHVTKYFYEGAGDFKIQFIDCPIPDGRKCKFSVDTAEDRDRMIRLFEELRKPPYEYSLQDKCALYSSLFGELK